MKELDTEFQGTGEVSNFTFKQIASSERAYVYEISDVNNNRHYETFERRIRQKSETVIAGRNVSFDEKVLYPKSGNFGDWAWCFMSKESAMRQYEELNKRKEKMDPKAENLTHLISGENILKVIPSPEKIIRNTQLEIHWELP